MKYLVIQEQDQAARLAGQGVMVIRMGGSALVIAGDRAWKGLGLQPAGSLRKTDLRLVGQVGRSFQREYPDVPVLLDKGRYLLVAMPAAQARAARGDDACFRVMPLPADGVVYATEPAAGRNPAPAPALRLSTYEGALNQLVSWQTRHSASADFAQAAAWARDQLAGFGLSAEVSPFTVNGLKTANVVARKAGTGDDGEILITAHLDSINHAGPEKPAPGGDDNASGVAGVLTLAEAFAPLPAARAITFILFGGEEQGLLGSRHYLKGLDAAARGRIRAVLNMDMIAQVNAQPRAVLLEGGPVSRPVMDALAAVAPAGLAIQRSLSPFASDHVPFIEAGIPAVLTIEGADSANGEVHTEDDTLADVSPDFAMLILQMNAAWLTAEAGVTLPAASPAKPRPQVADCGCGCADCGDPAERAARNRLNAHYQALFAQYARAGSDRALAPDILARWHQARDAHAGLQV